MVMAIPAVFAIGGAAIGASVGYAALGMSVGMLIGSWVYGSLQKGKNQIFDPGAQELPRPNSAVRGSTQPILFGTNRVPAQIVWQNNFRAIKQESNSGGGGKFGGSGMGKSGATSTSVSYTYKIDIIYHLGMPDLPYNIYGGWSGGDRINDNSIIAIAKNYESGGLNINSGGSSTESIYLTFGEGVYFPGNHPEDEDWDVLTTAVNAPVRWPGTAWVGFQDFNLGGSPAIAQLAFEIGPGSGDIEFGSGYIADTSWTDDHRLVGNNYITGDDGKKYVVLSHGNISNAKIICIDDGTSFTLSEQNIESDVAGISWTNGNNGGGAPLSLNINDGAGTVKAGVVNGTNYFLGHQVSLSGNIGKVFVLYKINSSGSRERVGAYFCGSFSTFDQMCLCGVSGLQTDDDPIIAGFIETIGNENMLMVLPSVNDFMTNIAQTDSNRYAELAVNIGDAAYFDGAIFETASYYPDFSSNKPNGFLLPYLTSTRLYFFVPKSMAAYQDDNNTTSFIGDNAPANPNGFLCYLDLGAVTFPADGVSWTISAAPAMYSGTLENFPFDDGAENFDGTLEYDSDYFNIPSVTRLDNVAVTPIWVVIFSKTFELEADKQNSATARIRAYVYAADGTFTYVGTSIGKTFDAISDLGAAGGDAYTWQVSDHYTFYDHDASELINLQHTGFTSTDSQVDDRAVVSNMGTMSLSGGGDLTPPYIIKRILTHSLFGVYPGRTDLIGDTSYNIVHQKCLDEGIVVSTQYRREENWTDVVELCLGIYGGYLVFSGGKFKFGMALSSADEASVRTIDNHHLVVKNKGQPPVTITPGALQDTANRVRINFLDRDIDYSQNHVEENDEVDQDINGIRLKEFPPQFVMSKPLAQKMAERSLWTNIYARDKYAFMLGAKDMDLEPGDVITLVDSFASELSAGQRCRIVSWVEKERMTFDVVAIQEIDLYMTTTSSINIPTSVSSKEMLGALVPPRYVRAYELPMEYTTEQKVMIGWVPGAFTYGARLYLSPDNVTYAAGMSVQPYPTGGQIITNLAADNSQVFMEDFRFRLFPSSGFNSNSPTFDIEETLNEVTIDGMHAGAGLMWVGSEMIAYEGVTLLSQNEYKASRAYRGWGGTAIHAHNSGDFWFRPMGGIFSQPYTEDNIGTTFHFKVVPYNFAGLEYDVSSIEANSYTILGRYLRPQNPSAVQFISSDGVAQRGQTGFMVGSTVDVSVSWKDTARQFGFGTGGYGIGGGYGRFATDPLSHAWRVEVVGSGGVVVRSTVVSTTFFTYPHSVNVADNGAYHYRPAIKVTPFGVNGDAIKTSVLSLELWQ